MTQVEISSEGIIQSCNSFLMGHWKGLWTEALKSQEGADKCARATAGAAGDFPVLQTKLPKTKLRKVAPKSGGDTMSKGDES